MDRLMRISQFEVFSKFDLKSVYHQIPIKSEESKYTASEACDNLYPFPRTTFGITNGISCSQRMITNKFNMERPSGTFDDASNIQICSNHPATQCQNLQRFLEIWTKYDPRSNEEKTTITVRIMGISESEVSKSLATSNPE